uniref:Uncharacterized protein n=1 Tax=Enterobacter cloacae TaxID=550 RepID=A0A168QHY9_ENTCL|nr:hypothetical protein pCY-CTX_094 [Enterobacter cloacae]
MLQRRIDGFTNNFLAFVSVDFHARFINHLCYGFLNVFFHRYSSLNNALILTET